MKKLILLVTITLMLVTPALARTDATTAAVEGVSTGGGQILAGTDPAQLDIGRASKGVLYGWQTSATGYAINTYHTQGTKFYGTAYDSTAIYFSDVGTDATLEAPTSSVAEDAFTGWTTM